MRLKKLCLRFLRDSCQLHQRILWFILRNLAVKIERAVGVRHTYYNLYINLFTLNESTNLLKQFCQPVLVRAFLMQLNITSRCILFCFCYSVCFLKCEDEDITAVVSARAFLTEVSSSDKALTFASRSSMQIFFLILQLRADSLLRKSFSSLSAVKEERKIDY